MDWKTGKNIWAYKSGIFTQSSSDEELNRIEPNHASQIVGWGEEELAGQGARKYWILRNTLGEGWGMHGDCFVERGTNAFSIEQYVTVFEAEYI